MHRVFYDLIWFVVFQVENRIFWAYLNVNLMSGNDEPQADNMVSNGMWLWCSWCWWYWWCLKLINGFWLFAIYAYKAWHINHLVLDLKTSTSSFGPCAIQWWTDALTVLSTSTSAGSLSLEPTFLHKFSNSTQNYKNHKINLAFGWVCDFGFSSIQFGSVDLHVRMQIFAINVLHIDFDVLLPLVYALVLQQKYFSYK